jgi:Natural resistance-associated macrophage protein
LKYNFRFTVAEAFGWKHGFDKRFYGAKAFYGLIAASTLLGTLVNFVGLNPVRALFWTAVINGFLAPPLLILIIMISNNSKIMGDRINGRALNGSVWATAIIMSAAAMGLNRLVEVPDSNLHPALSVGHRAQVSQMAIAANPDGRTLRQRPCCGRTQPFVKLKSAPANVRMR